jgi:two-component system, OmpR family, response regulator
VAAYELSALLVEDDARLARFTAEFLQQHGVFVTHVSTGPLAVREALGKTYDVIVLDLMLPEQDGLSVCRELRQHLAVPIVMVTARTEESERIVGLELGADDYLPKPFSPRELLARMRAVVRRARGQVGPEAHAIRVGPLELFPSSRRVTMRGVVVDLTGYEFTLLHILAERRGRVLSRERLLELAKGSAEDAFDRSIDVRISRLRRKLGDSTGREALLRTIRGQGYVLTWDPP